MNVCIVIPMHNEELIAQESIKTILQYTKKLPPVVTLVVVNDGSVDNTALIIGNMAKQLNEREFVLINHLENHGYGTALRTGILFAIDRQYDYVLFMDSDLTNHPKYLKDFYDKMLEGWDYIKATRYANGGHVEGVTWERKVISRAGNIFAKCFYRIPISDLTNGFRAVKVDILRQMNLKETGLAIIMEELFQAKYLTKNFCEIPYVLTSRSEEMRDASFSCNFKTYKNYLRYVIKNISGL